MIRVSNDKPTFHFLVADYGTASSLPPCDSPRTARHNTAYGEHLQALKGGRTPAR
jgi:hypothetical protein